MKYDVILSNKMNQLSSIGLFLKPIILPILAILLCPFFCSRNITYWCIEPNIKNFSFSFRKRNFNAPIQISSHRSWFKSAVNPGHTLTSNLIPPFFRIVLLNPVQFAFFYPLFQPIFMLVHWKKPM